METRYVGRFEVLGPTTVGGADALAAVDPATGAAVALRRVDVAAEGATERWTAYVARLAELDHPAIARVRELVPADGAAYVVQDRVDGPTLADLLAAVRPTQEQALGVAVGVLDALARAHAAGVVSGSLDPVGIVVDGSGAARLVDLGLAGAFGATPAQAYAAPERLTGQAPTAASDVYSAAAIAAHLLRGAPTLPPGTDGLDPAGAAVLGPPLAVDPGSRPSAAEVAAALTGLAGEQHGPDWRARASIAGLVAGGGAGAGAALGAAPAAAAPAAGGLASLGGAAAGATPGAASAAAGHGAVAGAAPGAASAPAGVAGVPSAPAGPALGHGASTGASSGQAGAHGAASAQAGAHGASSAQAASTAGHGASTGASSAAGHGAAHGAAGAGKGGLALKAGLAAGAVVVGGGVVAAAFLLTGGHTEEVRVPGTADVYLAGNDEVELGDPGTEPVGVDVDGAGTVSFEDVQGEVAACNGCEPEAVDGGNKSYGSTALDAANGIAGVQHDERSLFLVGVFVGSGAPDRTDVVDLTDANDRSEQHPALGQPFFVGDGLDAHGDQQEVTVPDGAKRLYLGFADGFSFAGQPGAYGDNSGTVSLKVQVD